MKPKISRRIQELAPSATLAVSERARALQDKGVDVVSFGAGQPDFETPAHIVAAAVAAVQGGDTKYPSPVSGVTPLRKAVCTYLKRFGGLDYEPAQVCVTVGAKDALYLAFATLLDPGDEVVLPAPYWVSYPDQIRLMGATPVIVQPRSASLKITPDELRAAITPRTRALVMNSPSNPTGAVYSRDELEGLAAVLRETQVMVISDEIYNRLVFESETSISVAALPGMLDRTITVNGFSKSFAMTGWRLGFAAGPREVIDGMSRLQGQTTSGPASFVQTAAVAALSGDQSCIEPMREAYRRRAALMTDALNGLQGVTCPAPHGAFYCFPDVSGTFARLGVRDGDGFAEAALERAHVAVVSGVAFGAPKYVRLSFATSDARIREGMKRLAQLLSN